MKSNDLQKLVLSKYENGNGTKKILQDLDDIIGLSTIERWCKRIREIGSISLSKPHGRPRWHFIFTFRKKEKLLNFTLFGKVKLDTLLYWIK